MTDSRTSELAPRREERHQIERLRAFAFEATTRLEEVRRIYRELLNEAESVYFDNERAYQDLKEIRHKVIGSRTLPELADHLIDGLEAMGVDQVVLVLGGVPDFPADDPRRLLFIDGEELERLAPTGAASRTYLGPPAGNRAGELLDPNCTSCAITPLTFHDRLIGLLLLGSLSTDRFTPDQSPDLIEDLAMTAALCLDNVASHENIERLAVTDPLTGAFNRRRFLQAAEQQLLLARRHEEPLALLYFDLNDFKPINDNYGHDAGDRALCAVVEAVGARIRKTDLLARLGGDEFAVLLPHTDMERAAGLVRILGECVTGLGLGLDPDGGPFLSAAFGLAALMQEDRSLEDLLKRADAEMFRDKGRKSRVEG